jgi:hypothetical protein
MEVYILDSLYRRQTVVDKFESFIWTEKFSAYGDFELNLHSTPENRNRFKEGARLAHNDSYYVMMVETVEDSTDSEGREILKVKGRSLEAILESRLARGSMADLTTAPKWILTGTPVQIATKMFHDICVTGILNPGDVIPLINEGSIFPADTILPPTDIVQYEVDPKTLYEAIKELCDLFLLGFRIVRNFDMAQLYFDVYTGSDRTTRQTALPAVVFSPGLDNLQNTTELASIATYKNVAYVISPVGTEVVYALGADPDVIGFDRKVVIVRADDITDTDPSVASTRMIQRGYEELGKNRRLAVFDGELNQNSQYKYGRDYRLGDLVQLRNVNGATTDMQVTEQIFVSDREGDRSYPTLAINQFVTPGSWLEVPTEQVWQDLGLTEYWGNQP